MLRRVGEVDAYDSNSNGNGEVYGDGDTLGGASKAGSGGSQASERRGRGMEQEQSKEEGGREG